MDVPSSLWHQCPPGWDDQQLSTRHLWVEVQLLQLCFVATSRSGVSAELTQLLLCSSSEPLWVSGAGREGACAGERGTWWCAGDVAGPVDRLLNLCPGCWDFCCWTNRLNAEEMLVIKKRTFSQDEFSQTTIKNALNYMELLHFRAAGYKFGFCTDCRFTVAARHPSGELLHQLA